MYGSAMHDMHGMQPGALQAQCTTRGLGYPARGSDGIGDNIAPDTVARVVTRRIVDNPRGVAQVRLCRKLRHRNIVVADLPTRRARQAARPGAIRIANTCLRLCLHVRGGHGLGTRASHRQAAGGRRCKAQDERLAAEGRGDRNHGVAVVGERGGPLGGLLGELPALAGSLLGQALLPHRTCHVTNEPGARGASQRVVPPTPRHLRLATGFFCFLQRTCLFWSCTVCIVCCISLLVAYLRCKMPCTRTSDAKQQRSDAPAPKPLRAQQCHGMTCGRQAMKRGRGPRQWQDHCGRPARAGSAAPGRARASAQT